MIRSSVMVPVIIVADASLEWEFSAGLWTDVHGRSIGYDRGSRSSWIRFVKSSASRYLTFPDTRIAL